MKINTKEIITMFYNERSVQGPCLCSDFHDCFGMDSNGLGWFRDWSYAVAFPTKEEAEAFCKSHKLNLDADKNGYEPRYVIVEEIRLPEVQGIAAKYDTRGYRIRNNSVRVVDAENDNCLFHRNW